MANIRSVAKAASVSISTVSAVLNGNKYVSEEKVQRVLQAVEDLNYSITPKGFPNRQHKRIAVILPGTYSSFFSPLISGIEDIASDMDYDVLLYDSQRNFQRERELIRFLENQDIHGIILDSVCSIKYEAEYLSEIYSRIIQKRHTQVVFVEREIADPNFYSVFVDNFKASRSVTEHLIAMGRKRIAFIGGAPQFPHAKVRKEGYVSALERAGLAADCRLILEGDFTPLSGFGLITELLAKGIEPDAVFAANDQMAIGAIKAIRKFGLRVPADIAVAGFDNLKFSSLISPGLTTVQYPVYQMGFQAAKMLADAEDDLGKKVRLSTRLIIRNSTDPSVSNDWDLQEW